MQNTLLSLVEALDEARKDILARLEAMPAARRTDSLKPGTWSMLQTAAHLVHVEQTIFCGLPAPEAMTTDRPTFRQRLSRWGLSLALTWRIPLPIGHGSVAPAAYPQLEQVAVQWGEHMAWLRRTVNTLSAHPCKGACLDHPSIGPLSLTLALKLAVAHVNAHLPSLP